MGTILLMGAGLQTTVTGPTYDPDAQLFFNAESAAGVTLTTTEKDAVNQWVVDSKAIGIWTKMKAIYPIVGGTATAHKFNLKNPLDTNAAFRLSFIGGGTHSSNGYLPNGVNAYANTNFAPSVNSTSINNFHNSYYSRTNVNLTQVEAGCGSSDAQGTLLEIRTANISYIRINAPTTTSFADTDSLGFYSQSRLLGNTQKGYKNAALKVIGTVNSNTTPTQNFYIGAYNSNGVAVYYSSKECAFATIGDGLTDLESQLFYQITEKYQVALGRNINTLQSFYYNSAYNNETNAFLFSTQITDNTIQTATNTLVTDLKTANIWTKMKAIYPMVGGTATTHKFNLANSQDSDAAFRLVFAGGVTHSSSGVLFNGTNGWVDTFLNMSTQYSNAYDVHLATNIYTDFVGTLPQGHIGANASSSSTNRLGSTGSTNESSYLGRSVPSISKTVTSTTHKGFWCGSRTANNLHNLIDPTGTITSETSIITSTLPAVTIGLGCRRSATNDYYSGFGYSFFSAGDGLTTTEMTALKLAETNFQTALGRI